MLGNLIGGFIVILIEENIHSGKYIHNGYFVKEIHHAGSKRRIKK